MQNLPALDEEGLADAVRKVCTLGLGGAQDALQNADEALAPLAGALGALARGTGAPIGLAQLLRSAIEHCPSAEARDQLPAMLDLERTGHTAAQRYADVATAIRRMPNTVRREKRAAWSAMLARAVMAIVEETRDRARVRFEVGEELRRNVEALCTFAALQLAALRRPDGSWAASRDADAGELSTTAWAATSLHKVLGGPWAQTVLHETLTWVTHRYDEQRGAFGVRHLAANPPGVRERPQIVVAPRQTASGIKLTRQFAGTSVRRVGLGVKYLIEHQARDGIGWASGGHAEDPADLLTTVYVLDALLAIGPERHHLAAVLDPSELREIERRFDGVVRRGVDWVNDHRVRGGWSEGGGAEPDPYVTAQVLGFAWQALLKHVDPTIRYLERICQQGGIPTTPAGPPEVAPTAMALLGLLRATNEGHERLLRNATAFLGLMTQRPDLSPDAFAATFSLLLGDPAYPWLSGEAWQSRARAGVEAILDGVRSGEAPEAVAAAAAAKLEPAHRCVEEVLAGWLAPVRAAGAA